MEIMPRLRLFTLILDKIFALTNKVLKYFFFLWPILQPSLELKAYTNAGLRSLEYKFSALFAKQIGQVLFSLRPCEHHLETLFFIPQKIHIYRLIFLAFSLCSVFLFSSKLVNQDKNLQCIICSWMLVHFAGLNACKLVIIYTFSGLNKMGWIQGKRPLVLSHLGHSVWVFIFISLTLDWNTIIQVFEMYKLVEKYFML